MSQYESSILIQSALIFALLVLLYFLRTATGYGYIPYSEANVFAAYLLWVLQCGLGPLLYLCINKQIRARCVQMLVVWSGRSVTGNTFLITGTASGPQKQKQQQQQSNSFSPAVRRLG